MSDEREGLTREQIGIWFIVGLLVFSAVGGVIAETFTGGFNTYESPGKFNASQGPVVVLGQDYQLEGGQPATASSINLSKQDGSWLNVSAEAGGPSVTVDTVNTTADGSGWTNVSSISGISSANVTLQPRNKNFTRIGGDITEFRFTDIKVEDGQTDLRYSSTGTGTIVVETNATQGDQYGLVHADTNEGLDVAVADANGVIVFTEVPQGTDQDVVVQELGILEIREETPPHDLITGSTATVRFFETGDEDNPTIVEVSDDDGDGQIDMTGLPVDESFAVTVEAPGYNNRTAIIDDLSQQQTVFLPNDSATTVEVTFSINDQTGDFGADSEFVIQAAINRSHYDSSADGFSWTNIAGDEIGAQNQFVTDLIFENRYRLRISNDAGETRFLGHHTATEDQTVIVTIQDVEIDVENVTTDIEVAFTKDDEASPEHLDFVYRDDSDDTNSVEVVIYERNNESNELHNETHIGPYGELLVTEDLTDAQANQSWVVEYDADRDGDDVSGTLLTGARGEVSISPVPDWVKHYASVFVILLIPTILGGARAESAALVATAVAGLLWWIDWLPPEISILSIVLAATIAVGFKLRQRGAENIT